MKAKSPLPFPPPGAEPSANKKKKQTESHHRIRKKLKIPPLLVHLTFWLVQFLPINQKATPKNLMSLIKRFATGSYMSACHSFSPHKNNVHLKIAKVTECVYIVHDALTPKDGRPVSIWVSPGLTP